MDTLTCIRERRSVRQFTDEPVKDEDLAAILEAVRYAPSWANTQCVELVVVTDSVQKKALQETVLSGNPAREAVVKAPSVIALCAKKGAAGYYRGIAATAFGDWNMFDAGIAAQNLCLAAWDRGYGTVHLGLFDHASGARVLGLPESMVVFELIPIGRPAHQPKTPSRRPLSETVHRERYGTK